MAGSKKHEVVMVFSGVIALGPPLPEGRTSGPITEKGPLFGVMPLFSGRRSITFRDAADEEVDSQSRVHLPVVFTDLKSDQREPDDKHRGFSIWHPVRERMQITIDGDDKPGVLTYVHEPDYGKPGKLGDPEGPTSQEPIEDFAAVPDMRVVSPGRSRLRPGVLDPKATDVAAQIFVPSGTLRSGSEDARRFGSRVAYGPTVKGGKARAAVVVPQVRITVDVDDRLTIESWSLDTGAKLAPLSFPIDRNAEIWIGNLDMGDVRRTIQRLDLSRSRFPNVRAFLGHIAGSIEPDVTGAATESCDVDFAGFYDITSGNGDVILPCETAAEHGGRKCYVVTVNPGDGQ
jgi:hypothetical protein